MAGECCKLYRRSGFECDILLIANCEFLHKTQSKESQEKEYAMNNATRDHTPLARVLACDPKCACVIDITRARSTCMLVCTAQLSIVEDESSSIF